MNKAIGISFVSAIVVGSLLSGFAQACDNVFVESIDGATSDVSVGLSMNSNPADSMAFSLAATGSRIDALAVGANSPNPLKLGAQVSMGTLQTSCSVSVTNDNVVGECSGIVDPKYKLMISLTPGSTEGGSGSCKHDNGNHKGEDLHKLGLVVGKDVPLHAGKLDSNGQPLCKNDGTSSGTSTSSSLSCQFVLVPTF